MIKKILTAFALLSTTTVMAMPDEVIPSTFTAVYDAYYQGDKVGKLERSFVKNKEGDYVLTSNSMIDGTYGFIPVTDNRLEVSNFYIDKDNEYHPTKYTMLRTGTWLDFKMNIEFDYENNSIDFSYKDRTATKPITGNVLDNALYQLRLQQAVKNNKTSLQRDLAYKTGFRDFNFIYEKNETISTHYGEIESIKFKQVRNNKPGEKKAVMTWFDPEKDFVMTRLLYLNKKGKEEARFELINYEQK